MWAYPTQYIGIVGIPVRSDSFQPIVNSLTPNRRFSILLGVAPLHRVSDLAGALNVQDKFGAVFYVPGNHEPLAQAEAAGFRDVDCTVHPTFSKVYKATLVYMPLYGVY